MTDSSNKETVEVPVALLKKWEQSADRREDLYEAAQEMRELIPEPSMEPLADFQPLLGDQDVTAIRAKVAAALLAGDYDLPNLDYDLPNELCVEDNDTEFRIMIVSL